MVKTKPVPCTKEEIDRILIAAEDEPFYHLIFNLAKTTGRRIGEIVGEPERIPVGEETYNNSKGETRKRIIYKRTGKYIGGILRRDIDFDNRVIRMKILKRRGGEFSKDAMLTDEVARELKLYCNNKQFKNEDYVFRERGYRGIQQAVTRIAKKANITHAVSFHNFRHYFVTEMLKKGMSYDKIIKFTGHQSVAPLSHYDHVIPQDLKKEAMPLIEDL